MKKLFTKISLLCIGLMLCAGNAWGQDKGSYTGNAANTPGEYTEVINHVTYKAYYTTGQYVTTPVTMIIRNPRKPYSNYNASAYITAYDNNQSELELQSTISYYQTETPGGKQPTELTICIEKGLFLNYNGSIILPEWNSADQNKNIYYQGIAVEDFAYGSRGDGWSETFGPNVVVYAQNALDKAGYESYEVSYIDVGDNSTSRRCRPWAGHVQLLGSGTPEEEPEDAPTASGNCGTNGHESDVQWKYYAESNALWIVGEGAIKTYASQSDRPWNEYANNIYSIVIDNGITGISSYAFANMGELLIVSIPASVESIGADAFYNCNKMSTITFEEAENSELTIIGEGAFNSCKLTSLVLPPRLETISDYAFISNSPLTSVSIPASVTSIGVGAFTSCPILSEITILAETPPSVTSTSSVFQSGVTFVISDDAICTYAEEWGIGYNYENALGETLTCDALQAGNCGENLQWSYDVDSHTLTITGSGEMYNYSSEEGSRAPWIEIGLASSLEHVIFPDGITTIGDYAFTGISGLKIVTIPATVTSIGKQAFYGCQYLHELTMLGDTPPSLEPDIVPYFNVTFQPIAGVLDVYVPTSAVNTYKSAWGESKEMSQFSMGYGSITYEGCTLRYYGKDANETFVGFNDATVNGTLQKIQFHDGETIDRITIGRPAQRNGYFNTLCLPFDLDADQINHSSLNGAELYTFSDVQVTDTWDLVFERVYEVTANTPYLFRYVNAPDQSPLSQLDFEDVTIVSPMNPYSLKSGPYDVSTDGIDDISLFGTITSQVLAYTGAYASTNDYLTRLFVGANNMLYTVDPTQEETLSIGAFRAYFQFDKSIEVSIGYAPSANRGSRIVLKEETATDIDKVENNKTNTQKLLLNGQVIINRNGVQYNTAGQIINNRL